MPRSVQALDLSVLSWSLKASVAVELELGCVCDPSCNIILSAASIVILLLAAIKVQRQTSCAFLLSPLFFFFFFFFSSGRPNTREVSVGQPLRRSEWNRQGGYRRWRRPLSAKRRRVVLRCDLHTDQARSFFFCFVFKNFSKHGNIYFLSFCLLICITRRLPKNVQNKMEGWESLYYLWVGMSSCVSLASRTQTETPPPLPPLPPPPSSVSRDEVLLAITYLDGSVACGRVTLRLSRVSVAAVSLASCPLPVSPDASPRCHPHPA